mgnify:FL=1
MRFLTLALQRQNIHMNVSHFFHLLLVCIFTNLKAQTIKIPNNGTNFQITTQLIQQERNFDKDTIALQKYLQPLIKSESHLLIYNALLANGYASAYDNISKKSKALYQKSIEQANQANNNYLIIWTRLNYVKRLYHYGYYQEMQPVLLELMKVIRQTKESEIINPLETYKTIGWIMQTLSDYPEADYYLKRALKYCKPGSVNYATILDNYGINLYKTRRYQEALKQFHKSGLIALKINDSLRYAKTLGNKALVYEEQNKYAEAIQLLKEDIALSERLKESKNKMFASIALARIYLKNNNLSDAQAILTEAEKIAVSKFYFRKSELEIIKLKLELLKRIPNANQELITTRRMMVLLDSLKATDGDEQILQVKWQVQKDKYQQKITQANTQYQKEIVVKNILAVLIGLSVFGAIGLFFYQKKKHKKRHKVYELKVAALEDQIRKMEEKFKSSNESLSSQVEYLKNKNVQINLLKKEIETVETSSSSYLEKKNGKLHALLESHLMTESNWIRFKREFEKEFPDFSQNLITNFPELTDSNKRIIFLQKLGFSNIEISQSLGITTDAVKKAKQRLKKKLGGHQDLLLLFTQKETTKT